MSTPRADLNVGDPFCGNCGYALKDLTDASRCPECGRPLVEVLMRKGGPGSLARGVRIKSDITVFGLPLYHIAFGPRPEHNEMYGKAKGIVAIGDRAIGGIAIGGAAFGGIAIGGLAIGACSLGGCSLAALGAIGGGAVGLVAVGGGAAGVCATGGGAVGVVAQGGGSLGVYARGPGAFGTFVVGRGRKDQQAVDMFNTLSPVMGPATPGSPQQLVAPVGAVLGFMLLVALVLSVCVLGFRKVEGKNPYAPP